MAKQTDLERAEESARKANERVAREKKKDRERRRLEERILADKQRKSETRFLILVGRIVLGWIARDPRVKDKLNGSAATFCIEDEDRALFELEPLPTDQKEKRRADRRLKRGKGAGSMDVKSEGDKGGNKARPAKSEGGAGQGRQTAPKQQGAATAPPGSRVPAQEGASSRATTSGPARG